MIRPLLTYLLLSLLAVSCGRPGEPDRRSAQDLSGVSARAELYLDGVVDPWYDPEHCDSLLFTGLAAAAGLDTDLSEAEVEPGVWLRKPLRYGECSPDAGTSRSILGVYWYAWRHRDVAMLERLMVRIRENNYQLSGDGTLGELLLLPAHINTLAEMIHRLGSSMDVSAERNLRPLSYFGPGATGFERHIQIWHILLRGEVLGYLSSNEMDRILEHVGAQRENPLYAAAYGRWVDGDQSRTVSLLEGQYPEGRLPTDSDYCSDWPIQRDIYGVDGPETCGERGRTHTGLDLVVVYRLILQ